ncbi:MAG: hypothetical protein F6K40_25855 [Okeania sp. SIO3I5]|uniref:hypothetical protein n=1 Tax=Okeania sp. SIO3I5 TaxID=2607805 RepID=UPI0013BABA7A|nr:hypothetical protein [Okeania sp. SIO3I5]NEQ39497.1 hypothetical protein [Okeania sp. SIO3I5]
MTKQTPIPNIVDELKDPLAVETITNWYLYGQKSTPKQEDLVDDNWIRPAEVEHPIMIPIDATKFMETVGRFALGPQFELVQGFFDEDNFFAPRTAPYSKAEIGQALGLDRYGWNMKHYNWKDKRTDDYVQRVYLYNSQEYKISDKAEFVVKDDGTGKITREIINFAIEPREVEEELDFSPPNDDEGIIDRDNFDFKGGGDVTDFGNAILQPRVDPSGIGRTVYFDYINQGSIKPVTYNRETYNKDVAFIKDNFEETNIVLSGVPLRLGMGELSDNLFEKGVTKFLDSADRPIFYGTEKDDELSQSDFNAPKLTGFLGNGSVLIGGDGNDKLELDAVKGKKILIGGKDNDTITGSLAGLFDTSVYEGPSSEYKIERFSDGVVTIEDKVKDRDGIDTLRRVEFAQFSDKTVDLISGQDISSSLTELVA